MDATLAFYACSITLGLVLGGAFVLLWRICVRRGATGRMVTDLTVIAKEMTTTDRADDFLGLYKRLIVGVGGYLVRNLGGLVLACLPMVLVLAFLAPPGLDAWGRRANRVATLPQIGETVIAEAQTSRLGDEAESRLRLTIGATEVSLSGLHSRTAICWSPTYCTLFYLLGFEVRQTPEALVAGAPFVVIRPDHGDDNWLWPYLSDLEFAFWVALLLTTCGASVLPRRKR